MSQTIPISIGLPQAGQSVAANEARAAILGERERSGASRQVTSASRVSVEQAIANAARSTSVEFDYLVAQARVESAMNPRARARTSSASGLYQFIESTWLNTVKRHGPRFGLGEIADRIGVTRSGSAYVADPAQRAEILELRNDPEVASLMAAGLAEDNRAHLMPILGRQPDAGELYLAHFLGAGGAGRFLSEMQADPARSAAALFRRPAAANRAVFFEPGGGARSLAGVMNFLNAKIERAMVGAGSMPGSSGGSFADRVADFAARYPADPFYQEGAEAVPYLITAPEVFAPRQPTVLSGASSPPGPRIATAPTLSLPGAPLGASPDTPVVRSRSMSSALGSTFEASGARDLASPQALDRVRRAYQRLRAMGL